MVDLPSWNDGPARAAVLEFLERVTAGGSAGFVPPAARIAVLDNDGTLWCERPTYVQAFFILDRLREQAAADPDLAADPVVEALLAGDLDRAAARTDKTRLIDVLLRTHVGPDDGRVHRLDGAGGSRRPVIRASACRTPR